MRKFLSLMVVLVLTSAAIPDHSITEKERKFALDYFIKTKQKLLDDIKDLTDAQLNWKPADSVWSIGNCLEHITKSEKELFDMTQAALKEPADPSRRGEVKMTDEGIIKTLTDRSFKVKTTDRLTPNNEFGSFEKTLEVYKERRNKLLEYMKKTEDDLRNHYVGMPFGTIDTYQALLFLAAHSERHTLQMEEVKSYTGFPK